MAEVKITTDHGGVHYSIISMLLFQVGTITTLTALRNTAGRDKLSAVAMDGIKTTMAHQSSSL